MRNQFERLVAQFADLVRLSDAAHIAQGGVFAVDDIPISLIYNEAAGMDRFFAYVDFGMPPADKEKDAYYELLKHNFMAFTGKGSMFTVSPVTAHVVYVETFALDTSSAEELANALAIMSAEARDWRQTYFLNGPGQLVFGNSASDMAATIN